MHQPPGRLAPQARPEVVLMVCTAGHVDHGKTRLVTLLTGCQTDRLREEIERGLTIELGFAPCSIGDNLGIGIVDVPGHEKFIKNMVAGVSGIAMTLLVIAADDGIMPQTIEHFQIMDLLGVERGLVALTKTDLVDAETVQRRIGEIRGFLKGTFLDHAPICPVSAETFEGYPEFYDALVAQARQVARGQRRGVFRMPVERFFSQQGFGSVVSGIPVAGTVGVGDQLELVPGGRLGRVRAIQCFGRDADRGGFGQCLALNIPDFGKTPPERGQVLCRPGYLRAARVLHLVLRGVPGLARPLENAEAVKMHSGTNETHGKVYLLEDKVLPEGVASLATIVLDEPVAAAVQDRFILRRASPAATVAGGEVLAVEAGDQRPRRALVLDRLRARRALFAEADLSTSAGLDRTIAATLDWEAPCGAAAPELARTLLLEVGEVREGLDRLAEDGAAVRISEDCWIHPGTLAARIAESEARLARARAEKRLTVAPADLRGGDWPAALWQRVLADLERRSRVRRSGDALMLPEAVDAMEPAERELLERMRNLFRNAGYHAPRPEELPGLLRAAPAQVDKLLRYLLKERLLIRLDKNVTLDYDLFRSAREAAVRMIRTQGVLDTAAFKEALGTSRKYAIAILEHLDGCRVTVRSGEGRVLTPDYDTRMT